MGWSDRVEAERSRIRKTTRPFAVIRRAVRLGGVLDDLQVATLGDLTDRPHLSRLAEQVHRDDGSGSRGERLLDLARVDITRNGIHIDRHRPAPAV